MINAKCAKTLLLIAFLAVFLLTGCHKKATPSLPQPSAPAAVEGGYPCSITNYDSNEKPVSYVYQKPPARVIITHPGATELLLELGLEQHILATVAPYGAPLSRLADKYAKLPVLKAPYAPSQEELLELRPDMLIGWVHHFTSGGIGEVSSWHSRGVGTFIMPSTLTKLSPTLENTIYANIADFGKIFNVQAKTDQYIQQLKDRVRIVESKVQSIAPPKTVLVLQDHFNGTFSVYGGNHLISTMLATAGGKNVAEAPAAFVGPEKILSFDPDFILFVSYNIKDSQTDMTDQEAAAHLQGIRLLQSMRAIREGNIITIPFFTVNNGGIRTIDAIEKIARKLYPGRFENSDSF